MRRNNLLELVIASRNQKKIKEIKEILKGLRIRVVSLRDCKKAPYINENGKTFNENAVKKAIKIAEATEKLTLGEDSGLEVKALGNRPGVYSSRFAGKAKSDKANNLKLLALLAGVPLSKRKARYVCSVALADKHGLLGVVQGYCSGSIGYQMCGRHGFGYDPLFIVRGYNKTFAQMGMKRKHTISHRFHALKKARTLIKTYMRKGRDD